MILRILLNYITGFVNITVEGFFVERFINNAIKYKIFLWSIKRKNSSMLTANIGIKEFKKLHSISNKTKCKVKINYKYGLPAIIHKYRKRKAFIIIILPIIIAVIILSKFIWNVEIIGEQNINKEELMNQLEEEGIKIGSFKNNIDTKLVINNIRLKRDDISWMSISIKGTNAIIKIIKATPKPDIIDENINTNIIATKSAIVTKITADSGTSKVKVGDIVKKGDILIGGYIEGKYTGIRNLNAKGEVLGKVWYTKRAESRKS